jgi:hypothetical protein
VCRCAASYEAIRERTRRPTSAPWTTCAPVRASPARTRPAPYDCLMLYSGGKDSTYALCRLVEMGLSVYAFTLDNGFISESAKENIRRSRRARRPDRVRDDAGDERHLPRQPGALLERVQRLLQDDLHPRHEPGARPGHPDHRHRALPRPDVRDPADGGDVPRRPLRPDEVDRGGESRAQASITACRRGVAHARRRVFADDRIFEEVQFVDFYRYCDVGIDEMLAYLDRTVPWVRPADTGRSTNCLINDVGIYVHRKERGSTTTRCRTAGTCASATRRARRARGARRRHRP